MTETSLPSAPSPASASAAESPELLSVKVSTEGVPLPQTFEEVHGPAMARGARCRVCSLRMTDRGPVLHEVRKDSKMLIIAEAPGDNEVLQRKPLVGWTGSVVQVALATKGVTRDDTTLANVIACQPPEETNYGEMMAELKLAHRKACRKAELAGAELPEEPVYPDEACRGLLAHAVAEANSKVILTLGKQALEATARHLQVPYDRDKHDLDKPYIAQLARQHGMPVHLTDGRVLLAAYHPAMTVPDKKEWLEPIMDVISRAAEAAASDLKSLEWTIDWSSVLLEPDLQQVIAFCKRALELKSEITCDIETDDVDRITCKIRTIQLSFHDPSRVSVKNPKGESAIVVPVRHMDGSWWFQEEAAREAARFWVCKVMDSLPLAGQFFQFDTTRILEEGFMTRSFPDSVNPWSPKSWTDITLLSRNTRDNDLPKNLGFITSRHLPAPMWKDEVDFKSVDNVDDKRLHEYGARDVIYEQRLLEPVRAKARQYGSAAALEVDEANAPTWRDMGRLGLLVNERIRGEFSERFNREVFKLTEKFHGLIGKSVNPRSVPQLQELFFHDWDYRPVVLTDGEELDDSTEDIFDDDLLGSTSSRALIQLQKRRQVAPAHNEAIESLLELRTYDKLRGTYVDNLPTYAVDPRFMGTWRSSGYGDVGEVKVQRHAFEVEEEESASKRSWRAEIEEHVTLKDRPFFSRVCPTYINHSIPTGRGACLGPNLQNLPAVGKANLRIMYVAPPGHVFVGADWDQLEARIYAAESGDRLILKAIKDNLDIHSLNAAVLLAKNESEIFSWYKKVNDKSDKNAKFRKYWRLIAKRFAFLEIYGGSVETLYDVLANARNREDGKLSFPDLTLAVVEVWHARWHTTHPETQAWHRYCHSLYEETGYSEVPIIDYRRRWFSSGPSKANAIPNMRIQGSAAAYANRAMRIINEKIPYGSWSPWTGLAVQIHDFLASVVPVGRVDEAMAIYRMAMNDEYKNVPITAQPVASWDLAQQG